ncbi:MAG: NADH-quinone oxidoreductase subunit H [Acidobacteria bacterium]|nr:NADH-quinone oxidoreductase subunit H [Acidobacteriota bacterium]
MAEAGIALIKIAVVLGFVLNLAALLTWAERKQSAVIQDRIGANRASVFGLRLFGLFHIAADALKMLTKEDHVPQTAEKFIHGAAPFISFFFALMGFAVIPFGDVLRVGGREIPLRILDLNIGILFIFAAIALEIYGSVLAGWSSGSHYATLGGMRGSVQMFSYEIAWGVSLLGIFMVYDSLDLNRVVLRQGDLLWGVLPKWGIVTQPLGFLLFLAAGMAITKRVPFDLPEGESEIIGYFVEYSGMKFGLFFLTDFVLTILISALLATLFFGGYQLPYLEPDGFRFPWGATWSLDHYTVVFLQFVALVLKIVFFCWLLLAVRWTYPRFRYDQLMDLGWKVLFPLAVANVILTGLVLTLIE